MKPGKTDRKKKRVSFYSKVVIKKVESYKGFNLLDDE